MGSNARESPASSTNWKFVVFAVILSYFIAFQQFKVPPVLPQLLVDYRYPGWVGAAMMSVYALVGLFLSVPAGWGLRRYGFAASLWAALVLFCLGMASFMLAPYSITAVLAGRALEGIGFSIIAVAFPAFAARAAASRDLGLVTGLLSAWIPFGQITGGLLALILKAPMQIWGAGFCLTIVLACWSIFLLRGRHSDLFTSPIMRVSITRKQQIALLFAAATFLVWSSQYFAFMTWLTQYFQTVLHLSKNVAQGIYLLPVFVLLAFNLLTGWAISRGLWIVPTLALCLFLQAFVWIKGPMLNGWEGATALIFYGAAAGITPTCLFHLPHRIMKGAAGTEAFAILMTGRNIGVFFGPILLSFWVSNAATLFSSWLYAAKFMGLLTVIAPCFVILLAIVLGSDTENPVSKAPNDNRLDP